jgi:predicted HTH transcriptional regulator
MAKSIESYTVAELQELIKQKQEGEVTALKEEIKTAKNHLADLEHKLAQLTGRPLKGIVLGLTRAPRGSGKANEEAILKFIQTKKGATTSEIREGTGIEKPNAALNNLVKAGKIEQKEKRADGKGRGAFTVKK